MIQTRKRLKIYNNCFICQIAIYCIKVTPFVVKKRNVVTDIAVFRCSYDVVKSLHEHYLQYCCVWMVMN